MATSYKPNSIYALTPMDSGKLGIWETPENIIRETENRKLKIGNREPWKGIRKNGKTTPEN